MDETLCDTMRANQQAKHHLALATQDMFNKPFDGKVFADAYVRGIYREWTDAQRNKYTPIIKQQSESVFRVQLITDLLFEQTAKNVNAGVAIELQNQFDHDRLEAFDFYPGITDFLASARELFTLVVITNGPEYSQIPKIEAVNLAEYVDHIIIGGQEPEEKPARTIFDKALQLANCKASEAIHVGDSLAADIAGAHNSGITSVWIQHQQPLDAELGINPNHILLHPSEIPGFIDQLSNESLSN